MVWYNLMRWHIQGGRIKFSFEEEEHAAKTLLGEWRKMLGTLLLRLKPYGWN